MCEMASADPALGRRRHQRKCGGSIRP